MTWLWIVVVKSTQQGFYLQDLPQSVLIKVIQLMPLHEKIKLAICSKRMEAIVKISERQSSYAFSINIYERIIFIFMMGHKDIVAWISLDPPLPIISTIENYMNPRRYVWLHDLSSWMAHCEEKSSMFEKMTHVLQRIQNFLPHDRSDMVLQMNKISEENAKEAILLFQNIQGLILEDGHLGTEFLSFIMDRAPSIKYMEIFNCTIPKDYVHKNVLKFGSVFYDDGRWIRMENLCSARNIRGITLKKSNFDCIQLNSFIKFWVESKVDMFEFVIIKLDSRACIDIKVLIDGLSVVQVSWKGITSFLVDGKPSKGRQRTAGKFYFDKNCFIMTANKFIVTDTIHDTVIQDGSICIDGFVLKLITAKRDLEMELKKECKKEEELYNALDQGDHGESYTRLQEITKAKGIITSKIQDLVHQLSKESITFKDGIAVLQPELLHRTGK